MLTQNLRFKRPKTKLPRCGPLALQKQAVTTERLSGHCENFRFEEKFKTQVDLTVLHELLDLMDLEDGTPISF
jgi:hypothetical protein